MLTFFLNNIFYQPDFFLYLAIGPSLPSSMQFLRSWKMHRQKQEHLEKQSFLTKLKVVGFFKFCLVLYFKIGMNHERKRSKFQIFTFQLFFVGWVFLIAILIFPQKSLKMFEIIFSPPFLQLSISSVAILTTPFTGIILHSKLGTRFRNSMIRLEKPWIQR